MNIKPEDIVKLKNLKILIVDDSDFSRGIVSEYLNEEGFNTIYEAKSAEEGLKSARENKPHLIITDIVMPEASGIELAKKITKDFENIVVIAISSLAQESIILEAITAGVSDYLSKPIQKDQLISSVNKIAQHFLKEGLIS